MKASLKLREDQNPLIRAKIPISVLGFPFLSGVTAGDSKELSLNLSTFFESGPSLKLSYRPNDSWNPFSFVVKTGIGPFGSPISAPMTISTEFSLLGRGNPAFFLRFKPQVGDFSIKKTAGSAVVLPSDSSVFGHKVKILEKDRDTDVDGSVSGSDSPGVDGVFRIENGILQSEKANGFRPDIHAASRIDRFLSGLDVNARSVLPLKKGVRVKFRWGIKFPPELRNIFSEDKRRNPTAGISLKKIPLLVINKICVEHVTEDEKSKSLTAPAGHGVADAALSFKRQLEFLQSDNGMLRKAVEELRSEVFAGKPSPAPVVKDSGKRAREKETCGGKSNAGKRDFRSGAKSPEYGEFSAKSTEEDVNEELKKALMAASGAEI